MFRKFFGRGAQASSTSGGNPLKMGERGIAAGPLRVSQCIEGSSRSVLDANPHFIAINDAFPHIGNRLKLCWGHQEFFSYLHHLLNDTRGGTRKGFPAEVLLALQSLSDEHDEAYPRLLAKTIFGRDR
jgi:hypothetical protein